MKARIKRKPEVRKEEKEEKDMDRTQSKIANDREKREEQPRRLRRGGKSIESKRQMRAKVRAKEIAQLEEVPRTKVLKEEDMGKEYRVHNGKDKIYVRVEREMLGKRIGGEVPPKRRPKRK